MKPENSSSSAKKPNRDEFGASAQPPYVALIGDIVASRGISGSNREELQRLLGKELDALNGHFGPRTFAARMVQTAGDEVQALLRSATPVVDVVRVITDRLYGSAEPQYIVFGIGRGPLSTGPVPRHPDQASNPALLDGPCFHHARKALKRARKRRSWTSVQGFGDEADQVLDSLFELMGAIHSRWTAKQSLYAVYTRKKYSQNTYAQKDVADGLRGDLGGKSRVSPSVVSESLKAAHFEAILRGELAAKAVLESLDREAGMLPDGEAGAPRR